MSETRLKFTVSYGVTINNGNYESTRIDLRKEYYGEVDEDDAFNEVKEKVKEWKKNER